MKQIIHVILILTLSAAPSFPQSCNYKSHLEDFRDAEAVFIGKVIGMGLNESSNSQFRGLFPYLVKLKVEKMWKGKKSKVITIVSIDPHHFSHAFAFGEGEKYLVYAFKNIAFENVENRYDLIAFTNDCTRSRLLTDENERTRKEMKELNSTEFRSQARLPF